MLITHQAVLNKWGLTVDIKRMIWQKQLSHVRQWPHTFFPPPLRQCSGCQDRPFLVSSKRRGLALPLLNSWGNLCGESQYLTSTPPRGSWGAIKLASQAPTVYMEHVNSRQHSRGDRTGQLPSVTAWNLIILMWKTKTKAAVHYSCNNISAINPNILFLTYSIWRCYWWCESVSSQ